MKVPEPIAMNYISGNDRNQMQLFVLEEMVTEDSWKRVIDMFVELLPLKELEFNYASLQKEGRPPYDPSVLRIRNNSVEVSYCIQAATDQKHKLFVHDHTGGSNDNKELAPMALDIKHLLDLRYFTTLSDAGYSSGDQLEICKASGVTTYSAPMPSTSPEVNASLLRNSFT